MSTSWNKPESYSDVQEAVIRQLKDSKIFTSAAMIEAAPGVVSESWLKERKIPRAGGAFVGLGRLASLKAMMDGISEHELGMGVFLVPAIGGKDAQAKRVADTAMRVAQLIEGNRFELVKAQKPEGISARNLYSPSVERMGSALWLIEWRQKFHLFDEQGTALGNAASRLLGREESVDV